MVFSLLVFSNLKRKNAWNPNRVFQKQFPCAKISFNTFGIFNSFELQKSVPPAGVSLKILKTGIQNKNSGPDFFNAKLVLGAQTWVGNVEVHIKSSDWYAHQHEKDPNYDAVILHVVWEYDLPIFRANGSEIETLELRKNTDSNVLSSYFATFFGASKMDFL